MFLSRFYAYLAAPWNYRMARHAGWNRRRSLRWALVGYVQRVATIPPEKVWELLGHTRDEANRKPVGNISAQIKATTFLEYGDQTFVPIGEPSEVVGLPEIVVRTKE